MTLVTLQIMAKPVTSIRVWLRAFVLHKYTHARFLVNIELACNHT